MKYKIYDRQSHRHFADGQTFKSHKEIEEQLRSYHSADVEGWEKMTLNDFLEVGEWSIDIVCDRCGEATPEDESVENLEGETTCESCETKRTITEQCEHGNTEWRDEKGKSYLNCFDCDEVLRVKEHI